MQQDLLKSETTAEEQPQIVPSATKLPRFLSLYVTAFYAVVTIGFTFPTILRIREVVPGEQGGDAWQMVWNLWWVKYALENGQYPFQTNLIFYPDGTNLYLHALNSWNGIVSLPVQYLFGGGAGGAIAGYNFIVWLALTLAGLGAFKLALYLWGDWRAAVLAGLAFGFCTYHFDHLLGHLNLISSEFIPFYILYFIKTLHDPLKWRKNAALAVLFLVFNLLLELQYVLYLAIFSGLYLLWVVIAGLIRMQSSVKISPSPQPSPTRGEGVNQPSPQPVTGSHTIPHEGVQVFEGANQPLVLLFRAIIVVFGFLVVSLPYTIPMLIEAATNPNTIPLRQEKIYSADLLAYFYPSPFHPLWGDAMEKAIKPFTASLIEKVVFPTFTVYILILVGLEFSLFARKKVKQFAPHSPLVWTFIALSFAVLSFGPVLHINGKEVGLPLPAALLYELPLINITRVPSRFGIIALLALALLAAWGLTKFKLKGGWHYNALNVVACGLLIFELLPVPYITAEYKVLQFYQNLANDPARYAVLDLPIRQYETTYMAQQMTHKKPLAGGYISRNPVYPPYYGVPIFQQFRNLETGAKADFLPELKLTPDILSYFGVRYVVVHRDLMTANEADKNLNLIGKLFPQGAVYKGEGLEVFEVPPPADNNLFFYNPVLPDWYEQEKGADGQYSRWAKSQSARLDFWTTQPRTVTLEFNTSSFYEPHNLELSLKQGDGQVKSLKRVNVTTDLQLIKLELELKPGQNQLTFNIGGKATRPTDLQPGSDTRALTIAVSSIRLVSSGQ